MTHCVRKVWWPPIAVMLFLSPRELLAQTAGEWFQRGADASEKRDYEVAARAFDEAFAIEPHPIAKYNAAENWFEVAEQAGAARAADAYRVALQTHESASDPRFKLEEGLRTRAEQRLSLLAEQLCLVTVTQPIGANVSVAHIESAQVPTSFYLRPGTYRVLARSGSLESPIPFACKAKSTEALMIEFPTPSLLTTPRPLLPGPVEPTPNPGTTQRVLGVSTMLLGGALAGVAIGLGVATIDARDTFVAGGTTDEKLRDEAVLLRALTNVSWAFSAVAHVAGFVVVLTAPSPEEPGASLAVRGTSAAFTVTF